MKRTAIGLMLLAMAGCGPTFEEQLAINRARNDATFKVQAEQMAQVLAAQKAERDKETTAYLARESTKRDEQQRQYMIHIQALQQAQDTKLAIALPELRHCIQEAVARMATASTEAADLVALAVMNDCQPTMAAVDDAYRAGGDMTGSVVNLMRSQMLPRIAGLVVSARTAPKQKPAPAPPPIQTRPVPLGIRAGLLQWEHRHHAACPSGRAAEGNIDICLPLRHSVGGLQRANSGQTSHADTSRATATAGTCFSGSLFVRSHIDTALRFCPRRFAAEVTPPSRSTILIASMTWRYEADSSRVKFLGILGARQSGVTMSI